MSLVEKIKEEAKEVAAIVIYLGIWFPVLATMKCLILLQYGINEFKNAYIMAFVSALALAKVIAVGQKMRLANRMNHRPLFWSCVYKGVFFTVITTIGHRVEEHLVHHTVDPNSVFPLAGAACHAIALFMIFFVLFFYRDLDAELGKGTLKRILFKGRQLPENQNLQSTNTQAVGNEKQSENIEVPKPMMTKSANNEAMQSSPTETANN